MHDAAFFAQPNAQDLIYQQWMEIEARNQQIQEQQEQEAQ